MATAKKATTPTQWRKSRGGELELPSGNVALVNNPGLDVFLRAGFIPDPLTGLVQKAIQGEQDLDMSELLKSTEDLNAILDMINKIVVFVVKEPEVVMPPKDDQGNELPLPERDQSKLYIDEVDFDDKTFIFQFAVGGTRDLERFRREQEAMLESVSASKKMEMSTE